MALRLRIKELREAKGWTGDVLAERVGVSRSYLSEIETGKKTINLPRLLAIASALGVSVPDLIGVPEGEPGASELLKNHLAMSPADQEMLLIPPGPGHRGPARRFAHRPL